MENEKTYPIYSFSAKWSENGDTEKYKDYPNWTKDLPEGKIWNSTGFSKMFKEPQTQQELDAFINDWWDKYILLEKNTDKDIKLEKLESKFVENETWFLTWFQHETFDDGQTDEEALESFERYVTRNEITNQQYRDSNGDDKRCLMGAEDRWRWHGGSEADGKTTTAPCRCEHCKKQGVLRIAH